MVQGRTIISLQFLLTLCVNRLVMTASARSEQRSRKKRQTKQKSMARRMFSDEITNTDAFLDMPTGSQLLYLHLGMQADDDGFISSPKMVMRMIGASDDELKLLFAKKFLLAFENGICVIKHWRINNQIRKDRYKPTTYEKEKNALFIRPNGAYTFNPDGALPVPNGHFVGEDLFGNQVATIRQPLVAAGKVSIGKVSIGKNNTAANAADSPEKPKRINPKDDTTPMNCDEYVEWMKKSPNRHMRILADYADQIKPDFTTKGQWHVFTTRFTRAARDLSPFTDDQIERAFERIERNMKNERNPKGYITKWTLETLLDYMHEK